MMDINKMQGWRYGEKGKVWGAQRQVIMAQSRKEYDMLKGGSIRAPWCWNIENIVAPSCVQLFATPWIAACQAPLSMEFSRQEYWNGLPFPTPGIENEGEGNSQWSWWGRKAGTESYRNLRLCYRFYLSHKRVGKPLKINFNETGLWLDWWGTSCSLWDKFRPPPAFRNKVLLELSRALCLHNFGYFHSIMAEWGRCNGNCVDCKA